MRCLLVVNPAAGGGRALAAAQGVAAVLRSAGWPATSACSADIDDARRLAKEAVAQGRAVIVLGGDGTASQLAAEVAAGGGVMGVLPGGRGNDFVRAIGWPTDPLRAARRMIASQARPTDLGWAGGHPFLTVASVGFDSKVIEVASKLPGAVGPAVYAIGALGAIASWRHVRFRLLADGAETEMVGWTVAACNGGVYGGGMRIAPAASLEDGALDLVTLSASSKAHLLLGMPKVFFGRHLADPIFSLRRVRSLRIEADSPLVLYAAGEPAGPLPAEVSVSHAALRVLR